jgi:ABC-type amino acid transport system permease subunit
METNPTYAKRPRLFRALPIVVLIFASYGLASLIAGHSHTATLELTIVLLVFTSAAYFAGVAMGRTGK